MESIFDSPQFNQNLFFPRPDPSVPPDGTEEIFVEVEDTVKVHARRHLNPKAHFSMIYFHGNGEIVSDYDDLAGLFSELGAEMIVCDYRGYGKSDSYPTLRKALADAVRIYDYLYANGKLRDKVCVMGRSLGSASAIELCAVRNDIACCVIESGYADPIPLVERRGLIIEKTTAEEDRLFNNSHKIARIKCPLLIMHGAEDQMIVPAEAELNHREAGSKKKTLRILAGVGHNDIMMAPDSGYFSTLKLFFDEVV